MRLYVARHGQTQWNLEDKVCGRTDLPLTEVGLEQARLLAERTKDLKIDVIISSPMLRARQTAAPTAALHALEVLVDHRGSPSRITASMRASAASTRGSWATSGTSPAAIPAGNP